MAVGSADLLLDFGMPCETSVVEKLSDVCSRRSFSLFACSTSCFSSRYICFPSRQSLRRRPRTGLQLGVQGQWSRLGEHHWKNNVLHTDRSFAVQTKSTATGQRLSSLCHSLSCFTSNMSTWFSWPRLVSGLHKAILMQDVGIGSRDETSNE